MSTDAEDRSTWPRNGQVMRRAELLRLIEENGGPRGLDLRGAILVGDGAGDEPWENPIDLSPEALRPLATAYRAANGGSDPPWLASRGGIDLQGAQLQGAWLECAQLQDAYLWAAQLQGADLTGAHLQEANLVEAQLRGVSVVGARLQGATLLRAQLEWAYLVGAQLQGADLGGAQLQGATLLGAQLQGARLEYAQLQGAKLRDAEFQGAKLRDAEFQGANLGQAHLERTDMYGVQSLDGARWYGAFLDHTRIRRDTLGKTIGDELEAHKEKTGDAYHRAKEAYLLLKNNFNQIGRYEEASWAYVKEQQMEKRAFSWEWRSHGWQVWRGLGSFWRWLRNWAYELVTGYGERPWNAVLCGLAAVLAFAVGFWATSGIGDFWDAVIYSLATFATFNLARLGPEGRGMEIASSLEAILGIGVLALVVFTLGNRMSRG